MRYLLDTNIVIFFTTNHSNLSKDVIALLQDTDNVLCVSAETIREIIVLYKIKVLLRSIGRRAMLLLRVWRRHLELSRYRLIKM